MVRFFKIDLNFYNNLNIIKIFTKLIEFQETTFDDIINMNLIEKVNSLIFNDNGDNAIFTEYIIELFYYLMYKINEQKKLLTRNNLDKDEFKVLLLLIKKFTNKIEAVAKNFRLCIKLIGYDNIVFYVYLEYSRKKLCEFNFPIAIIPRYLCRISMCSC